VLTLGGITAVMGVLYALMQHDLKRLLAYHTVENIRDHLYWKLGLALAFKVFDMPSAAALALTRKSPARVQSFRLQEPTVLRRRRCADGDSGNVTWSISGPHSPHAPDGYRISSSVASPSRPCRHSTASSPSG